jgi:ubiquinone/menaquinone biosynthesis C-methylase UbiE
MADSGTLQQVSAFWATEACGTHFVRDFADEREFYDKFRQQRYRTEWHIPLLVPFAQTKGKKVLEIGTGNGADGVMFALNGADYTGVDLTDTALEATRRHFAVMGLTGSFQREDAESLSFPNERFDWVYSHGVLHHTPNTQRAIDEVWRVLKPGGKTIVMLYHKHSFNYFVRIMSYMRLRVLLKILSRFGRWERDRRKTEMQKIVGLRGNQNRQVWEIHYQNFLRQGWPYLRARNFVHHCTDGPECPVAYAFSRSEAKKLFSRFSDVRMTVAHFPLRRYGFGKWIPFAVEKWLAPKIGWYLFIHAQKPADLSRTRIVPI